MSWNPLDWPLSRGAVPIVLTVLAAATLAGILWSRRRTWWIRAVPICLGVTAVLLIAADLLIDNVIKPFPDKLPIPVVLWSGLTVFGIAVVAAGMRRWRWRRRILAVLGVLLLLLATSAQINAHFDQYPTMRALLSPLLNRPTQFDPSGSTPRGAIAAPPDGYLSDVWRPPPDMPPKGELTKATIPSSKGFPARPAVLYLPPAYRTTPRAELPVVVLMAGQPGSPSTWVDSGLLPDFMDQYAREHNGLAPVVVIADNIAADFNNPLCTDSSLGAAETYMSKDVPAWIEQNLQVTPDHTKWTVAGLSSGGTCALQLAVRAPAVYPNFIDISGQREPTLGNHTDTVRKAFGGNEAAFAAINPLDIMRRQRFDQTHGLIVAGSKDSQYKPEAQQVFRACQAAGMRVDYQELPGGHSWDVWRPGFQKNLPWVAERTRLAR